MFDDIYDDYDNSNNFDDDEDEYYDLEGFQSKIFKIDYDEDDYENQIEMYLNDDTRKDILNTVIVDMLFDNGDYNIDIIEAYFILDEDYTEANNFYDDEDIEFLDDEDEDDWY